MFQLRLSKRVMTSREPTSSLFLCVLLLSFGGGKQANLRTIGSARNLFIIEKCHWSFYHVAVLRTFGETWLMC